ncbi:MAG: 3-deoxy-manno-octulosonate cytidylyltransferase [Gammaproteobacteria bacterium]
MSDIGIFIPTRMGAVRLPNKPMALICGKPMLEHVINRAQEAKIADVVIASPDQELVDFAKKLGVNAVLTDATLKTGTDAVHQAYKKSGKKYKYIVNLQGDMPMVKTSTITSVIEALRNSSADISTAAHLITDPAEVTNPNVVKAVIGGNGKGLYFSRTSNFPYGEGDYYHHLGIYAFKENALERFVNLPQSELEKRERLEQLRALENGMTIEVVKVNDHAIGIDTEADLQLANSRMAAA